MIEALNASETVSPKNTEKDSGTAGNAAGFSFAAAVTALEGRAAQSLKTFGGTPQETAGATISPRTEKTDNAPQRQQASASAVIQRNSNTTTTERGPAAPELLLKPEATPPQALPLAAPPPLPSAVAQAIVVNTPIQQQTPTATRTEAPRSINIDVQKAAEPKAPRPSTAPTTQQPSEDFAKLLARRLNNGATSFELRLDPPELGRVEAHLKVADDGDSVLSLKFENQNALDLFSRDEAALRTALMSSGFNLDGEKLTFTLASDDNAAGQPSNHTAISAADSYEPLFNAPFSDGAVDIRI